MAPFFSLTGRAHQYNLAGRRTGLAHSDGFFVSYEHNVAGDMTAIKENGAVSLAQFGYDNLGRRVSLTRGNGTVTSYGYDPVSRLGSFSLDLGGTAHDHNVTLSYNAASQIVSRTGSNDLFAWTGHANAGIGDVVNGLNQLTATWGVGVSHDARGNTSAIGGTSYGYTSENRLASGGGALFAYDPLGRLHHRFASDAVLQYDGQALIAELGAGFAVTKRFVHGPGTDEVLVEYMGAGTSDKRWLHADERGSVVALSDANGTVTAVNKYDGYGQPQGTLTGRFGYTGQAWLPEIGLSYYKARIYNPVLGRFMQTDPIGYAAGMNLYDYVSGDPVNRIDPSGLAAENNAPPPKCIGSVCSSGTITVVAPSGSISPGLAGALTRGFISELLTVPAGSVGAGVGEPEIIVTGKREPEQVVDSSPIWTPITITAPTASLSSGQDGSEPEGTLRSCYTVSGVQICDREQTEEERCLAGQQMKVLGGIAGGTSAVATGARNGFGVTGVTLISRGLGWTTAVLG